jgi:hypothetical protein
MFRNWCVIVGLAFMVAVGCPGEPGPGDAQDQLEAGLATAQEGATSYGNALSVANLEALRSSLADMELGMAVMVQALEYLCTTGLYAACQLAEERPVAYRASSSAKDNCPPRDPRCKDEDDDDDYRGRYSFRDKNAGSGGDDCGMADSFTAAELNNLTVGWKLMLKGMEMLHRADLAWNDDGEAAQAQALKGVYLFTSGADTLKEALRLAPTAEQDQ